MRATGLPAAIDRANQNGLRFPNASGEYREARDAWLAEDSEARRHIEHVAAQRRVLPHGDRVLKNQESIGENGPARFADLSGDWQTLAVDRPMYGPQRNSLARCAVR